MSLSFTSVRGRAGIAVVVADFDYDGKPDIYVANDTTMNFLFRNLGGMKFEDISLISGAGLNLAGRPMGGMGRTRVTWMVTESSTSSSPTSKRSGTASIATWGPPSSRTSPGRAASALPRSTSPGSA